MLGRSVRTSQPQGPARIDWSNPICRGLEFAVLPGQRRDSANKIGGLATLGTGTTVFGTSIYAPGTHRDNGLVVKSGQLLGPLQNSTVVAIARTSAVVVGSGVESDGFIDGGGNALYSERGSSGNDIYKLDASNPAALGLKPVFTYRNDGGVLLQQNVAPKAAFNDGRAHFYAARKQLTSHTIFLDNESSSGTFGSGSSSFTDASNQVRIGSDLGDVKASWNGFIDLVAGWSRALSDAEIKSLSDNPWQLFASDSKALWTPAETISGAGSSITAASGSSTTSTATGQAQAASTQTATTGTSTTSTLTGSAVSSATITAANGTSTTGTLAPGGSSAATITPADGTSTASTMVGSSTSGANVADGPPIGGFVAIGQLGPASPVASGSTIAPASGSSIAETLTSSTSAAATITSAAGTSVTSTMVGASTSGTAATMTAAGGTSITSTMTSSAISSAVMLVNSSSSITSTMVGFPPTENNADTHDGYFHKLWAKLAKKPEYQLEILEERLEEIAEEIEQVKAIPVVYKSATTPQLPQFDAQAKLLQALILESARIRRDIEDEEEAEMLLML